MAFLVGLTTFMYLLAGIGYDRQKKKLLNDVPNFKIRKLNFQVIQRTISPSDGTVSYYVLKLKSMGQPLYVHISTTQRETEKLFFEEDGFEMITRSLNFY